MNLFMNNDRPILDCLTRVYRKNGQYIQTTKQYKQRSAKMNDEIELTRYYNSLGYKNLGSVNLSVVAAEECQKSKDKQEHKIGRCYYLIALHDLKEFVTLDCSD